MTALELIPPRMLIVDDVEDNRALLRRFFAKRDYEVVEAENGEAALGLIDSQRFDVVMLDVMMPGRNGIDVLKAIRRKFSADRLPVIMVTARGGIADVVEALEIGANDYLTKPVELSVAFARVANQLERKRAQDALERTVAKLNATIRQLEIEILELRQADALMSHISHHHDAVARLQRVGSLDMPGLSQVIENAS